MRIVIVLLLLLLPAEAGAHALVVGRSPAAGAVLPQSPREIRITWSEPVTAATLVGIAADGSTITGPIASDGAVLRAPVSAALPDGRYAYATTATSADGHVVAVASAFAVRLLTPAAAATTITAGDHRLRLSGARVGARTVRLWGRLRSGTIRWTTPLVPAPFVWTFRNGTARGMLPFAGTYTFEVRARTGPFTEAIVRGSAAIAP